jgi:hypothetical protein
MMVIFKSVYRPDQYGKQPVSESQKLPYLDWFDASLIICWAGGRWNKSILTTTSHRLLLMELIQNKMPCSESVSSLLLTPMKMLALGQNVGPSC